MIPYSGSTLTPNTTYSVRLRSVCPSDDSEWVPNNNPGLSFTTTSAPIEGCTNQNACNYNSAATEDDGSCGYASYPVSNITQCDSYTWNGETYTESGNYTYEYINAAGCDSTAILNLTINETTFGVTDV